MGEIRAVEALWIAVLHTASVNRMGQVEGKGANGSMYVDSTCSVDGVPPFSRVVVCPVRC